ncbi:sulfate ABC transporter permease [Haladaptatus sp. W1]|uniref:ABC transporter permease n=1 Tax=Haladaptatus sp. W1 TaxID=1897478 RepID=UPI000849BCFA|nr:ABC transporter permease [Haladaptatus sp. W1]ODR81635.1 sulfate ABC transporter permease [Haladaptatus sp. W1]
MSDSNYEDGGYRAQPTAMLGRGSVVLAVLTVQAIAFGTLYVIGQPTLYVGVALGSAALLGWRANDGWFGVAAATFGVVLLLALGMPLVMFITRQNPSLVVEAARSSEVHTMLYLTIYGPLLATVASLVFGVPLAYLLARGFSGQAIVESLVDLPLVVPHSVAGILILFGFGRRGLFPGVSVLTTITGMVLALTFVSAPFAVNTTREAFETIDSRLEYAARSHGATPFETFRRIQIPLAYRGILTGGVLAWARGVSEFGAVAVVAYSVNFFYPFTGEETVAQHAPVYIFNTFTSAGLADASAVAFILLVMSAGIFLVVRLLTDTESGSVL